MELDQKKSTLSQFTEVKTEKWFLQLSCSFRNGY